MRRDIVEELLRQTSLPDLGILAEQYFKLKRSRYAFHSGAHKAPQGDKETGRQGEGERTAVSPCLPVSCLPCPLSFPTATVLRVAAIFALTPRQTEVLGGLLAGLAIKLIARQLNISPRTVQCHATAVYGALGVSGRYQMMARYGGDSRMYGG